jgi:hypothetical protein
MTKAYDLAVGGVVNTSNFVTKSNGAIEALDGSALTSLTPANLDDTGTIPSQLLAGVGGGGITQMSQFRLINNVGGNQDPLSGWEEADDATYSRVGDQFTESGGIFTFPETGVYLVLWDVACNSQSNSDSSVAWEIYATANNGGAWDRVARNTESFEGSYKYKNTNLQAVVDVTDISTHKIKCATSGHPSSPILTNGNTDSSFGGLTFIRLSDT